MGRPCAGEPTCDGPLFVEGLNSNDDPVCCTLSGCTTLGDGDGDMGGDGDMDDGDGDMGGDGDMDDGDMDDGDMDDGDMDDDGDGDGDGEFLPSLPVL